MIEFGSDFHYISPGSQTGKSIRDYYPSANYYADGRQALIHLYQTQGWDRLWVPEYFCYDVIASFKKAGIELCFYTDYPGNEGDSNSLKTLIGKGLLHSQDALLRVNYFGMRTYRSSDNLPVTVVEDHTHDILGWWARHSEADWCIASLRKLLPIPEGGILWSPAGLSLPRPPECSAENEEVAAKRWKAMRLKTQYLAGEAVEKSSFRNGFVKTEGFFNTASVSSLDHQSYSFLSRFGIENWFLRKRENWGELQDINKVGVHILEPENVWCYPFSLILCFDSLLERERVRSALIEKSIYPAILWDIPTTKVEEISKFSKGMLSIHCDARYSITDIQRMKFIIESIL